MPQEQSKYARVWAGYAAASYPSSAVPLLLMYLVLVAYASLYPMTGWHDMGLSPFSFLYAPWPSYWDRFDVVANALGYMPIGFLVAFLILRPRRQTGVFYLYALLAALLAGGAFSFLMEALQTYLPSRYPSQADLLLNTGGAAAGGLVALAMRFVGLIGRWSYFRNNWIAPHTRWALILLVLWPFALLIPSMIPFGLGHVLERLELFAVELLRDTPYLEYIPQRSVELQPLHDHVYTVCVALGLLTPCLIAFVAVPKPTQRLVALAFWVVAGSFMLTLSWALSYGPQHAVDWLLVKSITGMGIAVVVALLCSRLGAGLNAALAWLVIAFNLVLVNSTGLTSYYLLTLQMWEQGRFVRFHGLAQWVGWVWPFVALALIPWHMLRIFRRSSTEADAGH